MKRLQKVCAVLLTAVLLLGIFTPGVFAQPSFRLGTDSAEMLSGGGRRVRTPDGTYYVADDGKLYLSQNGEDSLISDLPAANLNYDGGTLYFTVQEETAFTLWAYDGSISRVFDAPGKVRQLYVVNGDTAYYSVGSAVFKRPFGNNAKLLYENEALFSFVPTPYGLLTARGTAAEYTLYADDTVIVEFCDRYSVDFDTDGGRIYYHDYEGDHQLDLAAAFNGTAVPQEYTGYGEVNVSEMLSQAYNADERELAYEAQTAQNAAASNKRALNGPQASSTAIRGTLTQGQKNAQKRAYQMADIRWTPKANILGWGSGLTYQNGTTYTGLPYGQPVNASYVPWSTDLTGFVNAVNNASSKMYTDYSAYNKRAPYYSTDCSAFVSWALNMDSRKTTASIAGTSLATLISDSSYANIQVGDFLNKSGSHVVICTDITYDGSGIINGIEISEATVVAATNYCCQRTWYGTGFGSNTLSYFTTKYFGGGYKLYRSKTISNVSYSHVCVSPIAGDVCAVCGYGVTDTPDDPPDDPPEDKPVKFGIDVSYAQGTINWDLVAPQIDFAIIRCGYGSDMTSQDDNQWARNVSECERLGIPYGVYLFSYVDSDAKAASEAQHVIRLLEGHNPTLPVFYDLESSTTGACTQANILRFTTIFCNAIEAAGYNAGVYANLNWWRNHLPSAEYDKWYRWVAQYNTSCTYDGEYCMWQNTDGYQMSGITANTVDTDYWYGDFPETPAPAGSYKVTFKVPTDYAPVSAQVVASGGSIILPGIETNHCGYTFMGWTTSAVSATTTQPTFYYAGQSFTPSKSMTLRAVFKYYKSGSAVKGDIYYPACDSSQTGLAAALSSVGATDTSLAYRRDHVAAENFIYNYSGTAAQNTQMLNLLKAGMLVNPAVSETYTAYYNTSPGVCHRATAQTTVAATCTASGTKVTSCSFCGYSKTTEIAALGHSYTAVVTQPTCTEKGSTTYTCKRCGDTYNEQSEPALQHDYIYHVIEPTCTEKGYTRATCSRCDFDEILDYTYVNALGHDMVAQTRIAPTCTEEGYTPLVCSRCDATGLTDIVDELGHVYDYQDNGNGTHKYYCTRCNEVFDAAEECVFDDGVCIGCGHVQKTASYGDFVLVTEAPSDWSGTYLIVCENNASAFDGSLSTPNAAGNYNAVTISDGVVSGSTTVRDYAVTIEKVSGTEYYTIKLGSGKYMGNTGSSTGINASTTKYQNAISLDANGNAVIANTTGSHTYNFRFNSASSSNRFAFYGTSTGYGVKLYRYIECPHSYDSGVVTTAATCEDAGVKTFTCALCGDTYTEPIAALGHDYVYGAEQNGTVTGTCSNCGDHLYRYRVNYAVPAFATAPESVLVDGGEAIAALPEAETVCGYVQMGWVSAPITETNTEPTFFRKGSAYTVNAPVTLYAVYACYKDNGELTGDIYYPACEDRYVSLYSALESVAAGTGSLSYRENNIAPAMYIYNYTGSTVQNNALLALLKNGMVIDPALVEDYTKYYTTAPDACLRAELTDNGNGTHTAACAHCGYTLTGAHTYEEGICACGASLQSLSISSAALVLNGKIDVVYTAEIPDGYTNARMVFTMNGETKTVSDDGSHTFTFTGVNPQCMGDNISATLYATKNGTEETVSKNDYSVRQYCVNQLSKTTDAKLRTLLSDILAYGAAAQTYMSYKTNALVNSGSDVANPTYSTFTALSGLAASFTGTAADGLAWAGAGLTLTDGVAMNFRFYAANISGLSIKVTLNGRTQTFTNFTSLGDGVYEISFTGINADEFADTVSASFYRSNAKTGNTVSYSVNTYVCAKQADTDTALANLVKALCSYGVSAAAYAD